MCRGFVNVSRSGALFICFVLYLAFQCAADNDHQKKFNRSVESYDSIVNRYKISNPLLSNRYAYEALTEARRSGSAEKLVFAYKLLGVSCFLNYMDSSFYFYTKANRIADSAGLEKLKIIILYNLAALHKTTNSFTKAIVLLDSSIRLAKQFDDYVGLSNGYNMLGLIKINTHDFENARIQFISALKIARDNNLNEQIGVALSNLSRSELEPDPQKSLKGQLEALEYLKKARGTEEEMANLLINIGNRCANPDSALFYYRYALSLAENGNMPLITIGAFNSLTYVYLDKKDLKKAEECVRDKALPIALQGNFHDWLSSLYDTYADVCVAKGDLKMALDCQKKALKERVNDYRQKATDQVRLLSAQLELQNKELTIQAEEKKILMQQNQIQKTELFLVIAGFLGILAVLSIFVMQHRNKVKFAHEKIESARRVIEMEESEKARTARELHDLTGQLVLGISGMIENIEFPEPELKAEINKQIKELGSSIRQISHRMNRSMLEHFTFAEMMEGLCKDYQKLVGLNINFSLADNIPDLSDELVLHFYRILQELLTNAGKYAKGSNVIVKISPEATGIALKYEDDGPGFSPEEKITKSMGMLNILERTKLVNGTAKVFSEPGKGVLWDIFFPVVNAKNPN